MKKVTLEELKSQLDRIDEELKSQLDRIEILLGNDVYKTSITEKQAAQLESAQRRWEKRNHPERGRVTSR